MGGIPDDIIPHIDKMELHRDKGDEQPEYSISFDRKAGRLKEVVVKQEEKIHYKFNEAELLTEIAKYIDSTYFSHYAKGDNRVQTTELIASDPLRGLYFCVGNVEKYVDRLGYKEGFNRKDLLKAAHYIVMAMDCLDRLEQKKK